MYKMVVMMGGQGVGKGTLSRMLMGQGVYKYIETGEMLRSAPSDSDVGKMIARGELVSDDQLFEIVANAFDCNSDIILDGFPRTPSQAEWLVKNYSDKFDIHILYLSVPRDVMLFRIQKRIREGGGRADDADISAVEKRINTFFSTTMPAINWLRECSQIRFVEIDGTGTIDENMNAVMRALEQ